MSAMRFLTIADLEAGLPHVQAAPDDAGRLDLIVARPAEGERAVVEEGQLDEANGLVGDMWRQRGSRHTPDGSAEVARQLTLMNSRAIDLFAAGARDRWALAGDQLYVDFDISEENFPPGTRIEIGSAVLERSVEPHTGCAKFLQRFGRDVARFVNSDDGRAHNLRGVNARVVRAGAVRVGDTVRKLTD
jgi:MOSC domain-containing protein YiiM